jgi:hypothetical protein
LLGILGAIAEFERARIAETVRAGLQRARAQGRKLGRPKADVPLDRLATVASLSLTDGAAALGVAAVDTTISTAAITEVIGFGIRQNTGFNSTPQNSGWSISQGAACYPSPPVNNPKALARPTTPFLYKYGSAKHLEWLEPILLRHTLYLPSLSQLNDPREARPRLKVSSREGALRQLVNPS